MIRELTIANLGVIEHTSLTLHPGLIVLSGETGAGKTLITTAVSQLLGGKADPVLIRHGAQEAVIDCAIDVPDSPALRARLEELGVAQDDDELLVTRTIGARSKAILGGRSVAASTLADIVGESITLHGQHGQTRLTKSAEQRQILDASATDISEMLPVVRQSWQNLQQARAALAELTSRRDASAREVEAMQEFLDSVREVAPEPDEDAALDARIAVMSATDAITRAGRGAVAMLAGDEDGHDVAGLLGQARKLLEHRTEAPEFAGWNERTLELLEAVQALSHDIDRFVDGLDDDPAALDAALARRSQIGTLLRRHGMSLSDLLGRAAECEAALSSAQDPEAARAAAEDLTRHCEHEFSQTCAGLHALRVTAAERLGTLVTAELHALGLAHADFAVAVDRNGEPTALGDDSIEFRFSANPGQPLQPLAAVGSGGELSRVMLALETATAVGDSRTFVFDEVDAGIGGKAATEVGLRLATLARQHQVIVVTHLAQVAAFADQHVVVEKSVSDGRTTTQARLLGAEERPKELARMLSGRDDSDTATAHAAELIAAARLARRTD